MNCRQFETNLADYIAGRLIPSEEAKMHAHSQGCPLCALEEKRERALRLRFTEAPVVPPVTNFWPIVQAQIPARRPRFAFSRFWVTAPVMTAAAAAVLLLWFPPSTITPSTYDGLPSEVRPYSSLANVNSVREIGIPESQMLLEETDSSRQLGRMVAVEGGSR
jgi:hypothetical protein